MNSFRSAKDAKSAKEIEELKGLVEELEMVEARPYAPDAPDPFKQELRGQLLQAHEKQGLSWGEMGRLWRFAGTAVAGLLLLAAVGLFWASLSNRNTAVGPAADTVVVATRTAVPESDRGPEATAVSVTHNLVAHAEALSIQFGDELALTGFELRQSNRLETTSFTWWDGQVDEIETNRIYLSLTFFWLVQAQPHDDYTFFVHLLDEEGNIAQAYNVATADRPEPMSTWQKGRRVQEVHHLPLGAELLPGNYQVVVGFYDSQTDGRLPVQTTDEGAVVIDGTAVQLADWRYHPDFSATFAESDVVGWSNRPTNVIFGDGGQLVQYDITEEGAGLRLTLYWQSPNDWPENTQLFVHLLNENGEMVWQTDTQLSPSVQDNLLLEPELDGRYDIIIGLYDPATGQRLPVTAGNERMVVEGGTAVWLTDWEFTNKLTDRVWIITSTQKARPSAGSSIEFEVVVGYQFTSTQEAFLKLHYAAPNWESVVSGRAPIDGMSDWIPLNPEENSVTITFTGNPAEMAQIVGTSQPALVVQLGYFEEGANGRELKILGMQTYPDALDLSNPDEVQYEVVP